MLNRDSIKEHYNTSLKPKSPTRISHIDFSDLRQYLKNNSTITLLTKCEIIIYRCKQAVGITQDEKLLLDLIADEIRILNKEFGKENDL